jgi:ankyrin repeat protein
MKTLLTITFFFATILTTLSQDKNELLFKAVTSGDKMTVEKLIREGADVNYIKEVGPWMKMNPLITSINKKHFDISKMLIENKADVNWKDGFKTSAIIYAAGIGNKELVELLLANGANINDNDGQGNTVFTAAKESKNKDLIKFVKQRMSGGK